MTVTERIRIGFVVHTFDTGGIERSVTRIANGLDSSVFEPFVICLNRSGSAVDWLRDGIPILQLSKRSGNDLAAVKRLGRVLAENRIDIVQSHNWGTLLETVIARRNARTPCHVHAERGTVLGMVEAKGFRHWLRARFMKLALKQVNQVVSNSAAVADRVQQRCGYPSERIVIVPNGVPELIPENRESVRASIRGSLSIPDDAVVFGSVGRLVHVKGFDRSIDAFATAFPQSDQAHLLLVGDGDERQRLCQIAANRDVAERVHMVGHQSNVADWMAAMDVYFNSSRSEGMSQSLIEAMAAGLPIVATKVGEAEEALNHVGICVESGNQADLTLAFTQLRENPDLRTRLGSGAARRHQECFSERKLIERCESLYCSLLSGSAADRVSAMRARVA